MDNSDYEKLLETQSEEYSKCFDELQKEHEKTLLALVQGQGIIQDYQDFIESISGEIQFGAVYCKIYLWFEDHKYILEKAKMCLNKADTHNDED